MAVEREVWPITNFVRGHPKTSNADRVEMRITVRAPHTSPSPTPTTRPQTLVRVGGAPHAHAAPQRSTEK